MRRSEFVSRLQFVWTMLDVLRLNSRQVPRPLASTHAAKRPLEVQWALADATLRRVAWTSGLQDATRFAVFCVGFAYPVPL